ncbi:MAG: LPP20 family lipoprotein [Pontiella sp.]|nr:LPP20 family lipoprotein [Pontiella sp.]
MKKLFCLKIILPALLLSQVGCKSLTGGPPKWLANPKSAYPEDRFLVAVGAGDTRRAAENAAAGNLARIFEAHIESDERLLDQTRETTTSFERTTDFTADISILSSQTLYNIQHAEAWKDKKGRYHAVAYFDRRQTASIYRGKIDELTARVDFYIAQAGSTDPLKKYAALRAANRHAEESRYLLGQLKIIHSPSASAAAPNYSLNELRTALADAARQINVQISIAGDTERRMTACLVELITGYGFVIGQPAVLEIDGRVEITDTGERTRGMVFVRYELALRIKEAGGNIVASVGDKGREAHRSLEQARIRSFRTMETTIQANGGQRLDAYFDSLVDQQ